MLTSEQLSEWEAYDRIEPIGQIRGDYRIAMLCALVFNIAQSFGKKGKRKIADLFDFMLWLDKTEIETKEQTVEEMKAMLKNMAQVNSKREK